MVAWTRMIAMEVIKSCQILEWKKKERKGGRNSFLNKVKKIFKINKESKVARVKGVSRRKAQSQNPSLESHQLWQRQHKNKLDSSHFWN